MFWIHFSRDDSAMNSKRCSGLGKNGKPDYGGGSMDDQLKLDSDFRIDGIAEVRAFKLTSAC